MKIDADEKELLESNTQSYRAQWFSPRHLFRDRSSGAQRRVSVPALPRRLRPPTGSSF
jgi:hypothetical protein